MVKVILDQNLATPAAAVRVAESDRGNVHVQRFIAPRRAEAGRDFLEVRAQRRFLHVRSARTEEHFSTAAVADLDIVAENADDYAIAVPIEIVYLEWKFCVGRALPTDG